MLYCYKQKEKLGNLSSIRDQRTKNQELLKQWRLAICTCRYTSGHFIPTLQPITMTELEMTCPLVSAGIGNLSFFTLFSSSLVFQHFVLWSIIELIIPNFFLQLVCLLFNEIMTTESMCTTLKKEWCPVESSARLKIIQ